MIGMFDFMDNMDSLIERIMEKVFEGAGSLISDGDLPSDIQRIIAEGQYSRAVREVDPSGIPWKDNAPSTLERKGNKPIGIDSGEMLSWDNIYGIMRATKNTITIRYGGSAFARRKKGWFEEGGRTFWGMDPNIKARCMDRMKEHLAYSIHGEKTVNVR